MIETAAGRQRVAAGPGPAARACVSRGAASLLLLGALWAGWAPALRAGAEEPDFQEVYGLVRSNLTLAAEGEVDQAALKGLLEQLRSRVSLVPHAAGTNAPASAADGQLLPVSKVFDEAYGYVRVGRVEAGLAEAVGASIDRLAATNQLKGLVLDLRYAAGEAYADAAKTADRFVAEERPLLTWGGTAARSTAKTNAFARPLMILINAQTAGAAEALAAVLRDAKTALILGGPSAGRASLFKEFPLRGGQRLRIATEPVQLANGQPLPPCGLIPDIAVAVTPEEETQYYADAYKPLTRLPPTRATGRGATNIAAGAASRGAPLNEAELVRLKREGVDPERLVSESERAAAPSRPVLTDPALARALDLLKGLAVMRTGRGS